MKKCLISLISLVFLAGLVNLTSCKKENQGDGSQFYATMEQCSDQYGKTILNGSVLNWIEGDQVRIYGTAGSSLYTAQPQSPATNAVFNNESGRVGESPYYAVYPADIATATNAITLPAVQVTNDGSLVGFPMYAESEDNHLAFKNLCGLLKLHLTKANTSISSIEVTASCEINGNYSLQYNGIPTLEYVDNGSNSTTLYCTTAQSIDNGKDFYIYLPQGSYSNVVFTITNSDGGVCTKTSNAGVTINVVRSQYTTISLGENDLDFVVTYPLIYANLDPTDPLVADIITEEGDTAYFFGEKDPQGQFLHLTNIIIKQHDVDTTTEIFFDNLNRPTEIRVSNGVFMQFNWIDAQTAALTLISPNGDAQLNTLVDFSSIMEGGSKGSSSAKSPKVLSATPRNSSQQTTLSVKPLKFLSDGAFMASKSGNTGNLYIEQCGVETNAQCWVNVWNYSDMPYAYGRGTFKGRIPCKNVGIGHYQYTLPTGIVDHHNLADYCDGIMRAISWVCTPSSAIGPVGMHSICTSISTVLASGIVTVEAAAIFGGVCLSLSSALEVVCNTIGYDGGLPGSPSVGDGLCALIREMHVEWNTPLYLVPTVHCLPNDVYGMPLVYDGTGNLSDFYVTWGGNPGINNFTLNPPAPSAYEAYVAVAELSCLPAGTSVTMSIVGTDGYMNSQNVVVGNELHYEATLNVPGSYSGVLDICTVRLNMPDGSSLQRTASLVFQ